MPRCSVPHCEMPAEWDFGGVVLCQEHWEEYCDLTWWQAHCGEKVATLEEFLATSGKGKVGYAV